MKLYFEKFLKQLGGDAPLKPVYVVSGDEPLQSGEACEALRAAARKQGYGDRKVMHVERGFDWQQLAAEADALSLFAERRLIELRMPTGKPGDAGARALRAYAERPAPDTVLLVISGKLESSQQKSKWYGALDKAGVTVQVWPVAPAQLPRWLGERMRRRGLSAGEAALTLLADRIEGNLLAADQAIEKLALLHGPGSVDSEQVAGAVADSARFDIFALTDAALAGEAARAVRMLDGLRAEGVESPVVLWALSRELRQICMMAAEVAEGGAVDAVLAAHRVWDKRKACLRAALRRHPPARWRAVLGRAARVDRVIKGRARGSAWDELLQLLLAMAGRPLFAPAGGATVAGAPRQG